jgi:hypothetical protein
VLEIGEVDGFAFAWNRGRGASVFGGRYGGCYFEVIFGEFRIFGRRHGVQLAPLTTRYCDVRQTIPIAKQQSSSLSLIHSAIEPNICPEKRRADATNFHVNRARDCRWACIYCTHVRLEGRRKVAFPLSCDVTVAKGHTTPYRLFRTATGCTGRLRSGFGVPAATSDRHVGRLIRTVVSRIT